MGVWEKSDLYAALPAICYFLEFIRNTLPNAEIYCLINTELQPEITACLQEASEKNGIIPITFDYIDKMNGHPTAQGMLDIKNRVLRVIRKQDAP